MKSVKVNLKDGYEIILSKNKGDVKIPLSLFTGEKVAIITDSTVDELYGGYFDGLIKDKKCYKYVVKSGEKNKNFSSYSKLVEKLSDDGFSREDGIIAFGGGMIGDLAGFVASTYLRGVPFISVPTTLLSMIDSSVGGKTAVNGKNGKNIFGTFYQPKGVFIDVDFLSTLPEKELLSGLGEALKYKYIDNAVTENDLIGDKENLIFKCLTVKARIVEKDELDVGERKALNFGHTFGHAIESLSKMTIPHGVSVAKGIAFSLKIGEKLFGYKGKYDEYADLCKKFGVDISCPFDTDTLVKQIVFDKKRSGNDITMTLINVEGNVCFEKLKISEIKNLLG